MSNMTYWVRVIGLILCDFWSLKIKIQIQISKLKTDSKLDRWSLHNRMGNLKIKVQILNTVPKTGSTYGEVEQF